MNKKFLAVGINHFKLPGNDLAGCIPDEKMMVGEVALRLGSVADAQAVAKLFKGMAGSMIVTEFTDSQATRKNVLPWLWTVLIGSKDRSRKHHYLMNCAS